MSDNAVDQLREQLRGLGYLSRGIERWFALDPWRSRTFWSELLIVAAKAGLLIAPFAAAFCTFVTMFRNHGGAIDAAVAALLYFTVTFVATTLVVTLTALALRVRAEASVQNPRVLTVVAIAVTIALSLLLGAWWNGFEDAASTLEVAVGIALLAVFFLVSVSTLAAATLSFSIFETGHIPTVRRARNGAIIAASTALTAIALLLPLIAQGNRRSVAPPQQIVVTPTQTRVALIAVDGLSRELLLTRRELAQRFPHVTALQTTTRNVSPPERWASIGTGTDENTHGVHTIEGVRLAGGARVLQSISKYDVALLRLAPWTRLGSRQPLPPTVRRRDYAWEVFGAHGVPTLSVNWWSTASGTTAASTTVGQDALFDRARKSANASPATLALAIDSTAVDETLRDLAAEPRFVTLYLPALDILLNRLDTDSATRVALASAALDRIASLITSLNARGYETLVVGVPGQSQSGAAFLASTRPLAASGTLQDIAPTLFDLYGFPASEEMRGRSLLPQSAQQRVASFGSRDAGAAPVATNQEYYDNLKSLGYIR